MIWSNAPADAALDDFRLPLPHTALCSFLQGHLSVLSQAETADPVFLYPADLRYHDD